MITDPRRDLHLAVRNPLDPCRRFPAWLGAIQPAVNGGLLYANFRREGRLAHVSVA